MRKGLLIAVALLVMVGCSSGGFNSDDYEQVGDYSLEIIRSVELAVQDVDNWLQDDTEENHKSMIESADNIEKANSELWKFNSSDEIPLENIEGWGIIEMSLNGDEWDVDGKDLAESLRDIEDYSGHLAVIINDVDIDNIDELQEAKLSAVESMSELRKMLTNK